MSAAATVQEAEKEAKLAGELLATLEKRVKSGDEAVTPAQLSESRSLAEFARLRVDAAKQRAAAARREALDERGAALREQAARLAGAGDEEMADLFKDAVAALARLARVAGERRDVIREIGRAAEALAIEAGTDHNGLWSRYGVRASHDHVMVAGEEPLRVQAVTPVEVVGAVAEIALDHWGRAELLKGGHQSYRVFTRVPAVAAGLAMTDREIQATSEANQRPVLDVLRERAADVSR
ncbi:hypothetical protein [Nonomuraea basaltis]|uniref:hypothetical protein n=1 Tax=Nonomuraea basaltis TaxID=2495887 RepID=UPI00110C5CE6|nr:hypothetical protein [Nonomuraea basaltis]TMR95592.1 hypothetical protein EJK15_27945 [Nonomuraea basaltis]